MARAIGRGSPLCILGLYIYLLAHSWLRWMDPMVDFPRDLYLAWRVSEGDLLYKTLANWYGPLAQLVEGSAFKLFGVGIDTIIWSNIALTAVVVILLRDLFQTLGNRLSGWLAAVVFLAVFAFGHYMANANYNFIAPYVAQSTYSFAGLVVVLWSLVHHLKSERSWWLGLTGLGLAVVGVAAALMMVRIFLNGRIYHFGFFMMPLAAIWLVHLMVVEAAQRALDGQRNNHLLPIAFTGLVLVGVYATAQTSLGVYAIKNFEVGEGRDHFYTYELKVFYNRQLLKDAMKAFKLATPQAKTLAVFPEGIAVNYHLRVRSSLAEVDFHPPALAYAGPAHVLAELNAHPPESIILLAQDFSEFGRPYFGTDEAGGRNVLLWINDHYWLAAVEGHGQEANISITHDVMDLVKPRTPGSTGITLLRDDNNAPLAPENVH